ncbi:hypothetical protein EVAR_76025_1 [Eumeta japonica]|uniref:Uncharacterized protein n=1 Tax=Eumeta variegata TaxID=151549 RepID=A0A4C1UB20_EUMVA|nr:hypothetical protein EVAR_76025_1 [Eumeta japonica]
MSGVPLAILSERKLIVGRERRARSVRHLDPPNADEQRRSLCNVLCLKRKLHVDGDCISPQSGPLRSENRVARFQRRRSEGRCGSSSYTTPALWPPPNCSCLL